MNTDNTTDIGPAPTPTPPAWCEPGATGEWQQLVKGGAVYAWTRDVRADMWITCEDRIEAGRVLRSAPRIHVDQSQWIGDDGIDPATARQLGSALVAAADLLDN